MTKPGSPVDANKYAPAIVGHLLPLLDKTQRLGTPLGSTQNAERLLVA